MAHKVRDANIFPRLHFMLLFLSLILTQVQSEVISQKLKDSIAQKKLANIIVTFKTRPTESVSQITAKIKSTKDQTHRLQIISDELEKIALQSQESAVKLLQGERSDVKYRSLWISNQVAVRGASADLINKIASLQDVLTIDETKTFTMRSMNDSSIEDMSKGSTKTTDGVTYWAPERIQANEVWKMGYDGSGVVVGIIDSGVMGNHDSFRDRYVGTKNYGWFDPDKMRKYPVDAIVPAGHGTNCLGNAVSAHGLGMAPGASWMACLAVGKDQLWHEDWILTCLQFMLCPTDYQGNNKNCSRAPHVITNSWYYQAGEDDRTLREITPVLALSNIVFIFCIGNEGTKCGTAAPPGKYPEFIGVGGSGQENELAWFSSCGPGLNGTIKPDLVAPGLAILNPRSTVEFRYFFEQGTSVAAPQVAGVVALMLQKNPKLSPIEIKQILLNSTTRDTKPKGESCEGIPADQFPNHQFGYGLVNALNAFNNVPTV